MKGLKKVILLLSLLSVAAAAPKTHFDHQKFDRVLRKFVANGRVNYAGIKADHGLLQQYLDKLEAVNPRDFEKWSRAEKMAFWINAYNAITIEGIVRHYPIQYGGIIARLRFPRESIRQIDGFWDKVFVKVMGKDYSLNHIEHQILRAKYQDPRVHFALVCASLGCPTIRGTAYSADSLNLQLDQEASNFISNPDKVRLNRQRNILYLSSIFDWYSGDFEKFAEGTNEFDAYAKSLRGVVAFVTRYMRPSDRNYIMENKPAIRFLDYDWSLNEQK